MLKNSATIAELQTKVTELELKEAAAAELKTSLEGTIAAHVATIAARDGTITELTGTVATHVATIAARDLTITDLTGNVATHVATIATQAAAIVTLEAAATTVDAAADVKAREIAAANGVVLPAKAQGHGDQTTEKVATGTPAQKLAAIFQPKDEPARA